jgi:hypothetical protein
LETASTTTCIPPDAAVVPVDPAGEATVEWGELVGVVGEDEPQAAAVRATTAKAARAATAATRRFEARRPEPGAGAGDAVCVTVVIGGASREKNVL